MSRPSPCLPALALVAASLAVPALAHAQTSQIGRGRTFGLGLTFGYPNVGLGINAFLSPDTSIQADLTWAYRNDYGYFGLRGDFLFWMHRLATTRAFDLRWYFGPGVFINLGSGTYYSMHFTVPPMRSLMSETSAVH